MVGYLFDGLQSNLEQGQRTFGRGFIEESLKEFGVVFIEPVDTLIRILYFSNQWPEVCYNHAKSYGENIPDELIEVVTNYEKTHSIA